MKLFRGFSLFFLFLLGCQYGFGQIGGKGIYKFMNLPPSARAASLGGSLMSVKDNDVTLAIQNPSLLNIDMHNQFALTYNRLFGESGFGSAVYARHFDSLKATAMAGIQYINYGNFTQADVEGNKTGNFSAGEYNIFVGMASEWKHRISYGAQLKFIYSQLEIYRSFGMAVDLGGTYRSRDSNFTAALLFRNIGYQLKPYYETREPLPFDIQAGISIKPEHMPVRFSLIMHNLQQPDISYINTNKPQKEDLATGEVIEEKITLSDKIARHAIIGAEILVSRNFNVRLGYNHQKRKELTLEENKGTVGFSYGFGFRVSRFHLSYGHAAYSLAGATDLFSITTNFSELFGRRQVASPALQP